jgi:hypothetical protein
VKEKARIEWMTPDGLWVEAHEPAYLPDGTMRCLSVEARWKLVKAGAKHQVSWGGHPARLIRAGVVVDRVEVAHDP